MKKVNKYLQEARQKTSQNFSNADGMIDSVSLSNKSAFASATGSNEAAAAAAQTSIPFVINITSTSGAMVPDFEILGANTFLYPNPGKASWNANGDLVVDSITISSGTAGVTYQQILAQSANQPFKVGMTYYQSPTSAQVLQGLLIVKKDANGMTSSLPVTSLKDPYQQQNDVVVIKTPYDVDGNTSIKVANVLPNATIQFFLFPSDKLNLARGLNNQSVQADYSDPEVVKAQKVTVQ